MNSKAIKRQLLAAIAMVLVAALALGSSTYAWFAANKTVTAQGMQVSATSSSSLVIAMASDAKTAGVGDKTIATFTGNAAELIPTTHDLDVGTTTGLKYNTNPEAVSVTTGFLSDDAGTGVVLTFADPATDTTSSNIYYSDYVVCIAASGAAMTNQDLTAKLDDAVTAAKYTMNATSIDFYVQTTTTADASATISADTYKGTLNVAKTGIGSSGSVKLLSAGDIPKNQQTSSFLQVTMRVYVDGALVDQSKSSSKQTAYVANDSVDIAAQNLTVNFEASTASA